VAVLDERVRLVPEHRDAMIGHAPELPMCFTVTHMG
jgi:hypothetical protein